ncbi:hypothetical protein FJZ31_22035 [Candidatus Poribacteria bacterium]|nr:hypothetical protein [Candidatus Poribacteria bacterium]
MNSKHVLERSEGTIHEPEEELLSAQEAWQDYLTLKKMEMNEYVQQILSDILTLPEYKIIEVADFVQFLKQQLQNKGISLRKASLTQTEMANLCAWFTK